MFNIIKKTTRKMTNTKPLRNVLMMRAMTKNEEDKKECHCILHGKKDHDTVNCGSLENFVKKQKSSWDKKMLKNKMTEEEINAVIEAYTVTNADKKGNTPAYQNYMKGMKGKDGKPVYQAAPHLKGV